MNSVIGIIAFEGDNVKIEGLSKHRPLHTIQFLGRYNFVDFPLSNMTNSGINNIHVYIKLKPRTVFEHIGTGRQYNINSKQGKIRIMYGEQELSSEIYNTDVQTYLMNLQFVHNERAEYVVIAPSHFTYIQNFRDVLKEHFDTGADITVLYKHTADAKDNFRGCDCLSFMKGKRLKKMIINRGQRRDRDISLETYIMRKDLFISLVEKANSISPIYWMRDIIEESIETLDIRGYSVKSEAYATTDIRSYYENSMKLLKVYNSQLFSQKWPIFTRTSDSPPSIYGPNSQVTNSLISNGSVIDGIVKNSIIGRDVEIGEGTVIENSVVMSHTQIGKNKILKGLVVDKYVTIEKTHSVTAESGKIIYVNRGDKI